MLGGLAAHLPTADDHHAFPDRLIAGEHVQRGGHVVAVHPGNVGDVRPGAGGHDDRIGLVRGDGGLVRFGIEHDLGAAFSKLELHVSGEVFYLPLVGRHRGQQQVAAQLFAFFKQGYVVATLRCHGSSLHAGGPAADDVDLLRPCRGCYRQLGLPARRGVHRAGHRGGEHHGVQAVPAGDAGPDIVEPTIARLVGEFRVGYQGARHADEVGPALGDDAVGQQRVVDAVGGDNRDTDDLLDLLRQVDEVSPRNRHVDQRGAALVPPRPHVEAVDAGALQGDGYLPGLLQPLAALHEIVGADAADQGVAVAHPGLCRCDYLQHEPHAVYQRAAVIVGAPVGERRQEAGDEVADAAHDLHSVEAGVPRPAARLGVGIDYPVDLVRRQRAGAGVAPGGDPRWADLLDGCILLAGPEVLDAYLGRYFSALAVHRFGELAQAGDEFVIVDHVQRDGAHVRGHQHAGGEQAGPAPGPRRHVGHLAPVDEAAVAVFGGGGEEDDAVLELQPGDLDWLEQAV